MRSLNKIILTLFVSVVMSGCAQLSQGMYSIGAGFESFGNDVSELFSGEYDETATVEHNSDIQVNSGRMAKVEEVSPTAAGQESSGVYPSNYKDVAYQKSRGSIEIFRLDGVTSSGVPLSEADKTPAQPFSGDGRVTIYNLDHVYHASSPGVMPLSSARPNSNFVSPFGNAPVHARAPQMPVAVHSNGTHVYFAHGQTNLGRDNKEIVSNYAKGFRQNMPYGMIHVEGHASKRAEASTPVERELVNLKTSMDRALAVTRQLMRSGVPAASIYTTAYGDTRPSTGVSGMDSESASRRVEVSTKAR